MRVEALAGEMGKTLNSHGLSTQVYKWVLANLMAWVTLRWTSIPSKGAGERKGGGGINILSHFMLRKPEISRWSDEPLDLNTDFTLQIQ